MLDFTKTGGTTPFLWGENEVFIGAKHNSTGDLFIDEFDGVIDELAIWNRTLNSTEIPITNLQWCIVLRLVAPNQNQSEYEY